MPSEPNSPVTPLVSVVITAYNAAEFIGETLQSVRAQTYSNFEVVVVNDGSTDGTGDVLREFSEVRQIQQPNRGQPAARNTGIQQALGAYIAFLDADDLWLPQKLEKQMAVLLKNPEIAWVYSDAVVFSSDHQTLMRSIQEKILPDGDILRPLLLSSFIPSPTPVVRKSVFDTVGGFDESRERRIGEDWNMWLRIAAKYPVAVVREPLAARRYHRVSMSRAADPEQAYRSKRLIVEDALARDPVKLQDLGNAARANLSTAGGMHYLRIGETRAARRLFGESIRLDPGKAVPYACWLSTWLPSPARSGLYWLWNRSKETRHEVRAVLSGGSVA